jgi:inorganic pyrophosphatase
MTIRIEPNPGDASPNIVRMLVEIPQGSSNKYVYNEELGLFELSRALYSPLHYPGDYGFIPGTIGADSAPLDVLCLVMRPSFSGCLSYVRPVAVLDALDGDTHDHKILAVPYRDPRYEQILSLDHLAGQILREIEHFFGMYKELEGRNMQIRGWLGREDAYQLITESRERYLAEHAPVHV